MSVESKGNASQVQTPNYRQGPQRIGILLCLAGIMVGGVAGELLRESMLSAVHQHAMFSGILSSAEVQDALAVKRASGSAEATEMVPVKGPWVNDLFWEDGHVTYFVMADGSFFFDSPRPPAWAFSFVVLCPLLGFLIPWGIIKILAAMGVQYFVKNKPAPA